MEELFPLTSCKNGFDLNSNKRGPEKYSMQSVKDWRFVLDNFVRVLKEIVEERNFATQASTLEQKSNFIISHIQM